MAGSYSAQTNPGAFVPTTNIWDVSRLYEVEVGSPEFKELLVRLYQNVNNIALSLNIKDTGYYVQNEFVNGQAYFPNPALSSTTATQPTYRQVFRAVVNFGALPNAGAKSVAHGIPVTASVTTFSFTRIYATATDQTARSFIPIPYVSLAAANIEISVDATNVTITTQSNRSSYTLCYVVLEYIKA